MDPDCVHVCYGSSGADSLLELGQVKGAVGAKLSLDRLFVAALMLARTGTNLRLEKLINVNVNTLYYYK